MRREKIHEQSAGKKHKAQTVEKIPAQTDKAACSRTWSFWQA